MWSSARVGTAPVLDLMERSGGDRQELRRAIEHDVRYANIAIIEGNQASQFGIGIVSARIVEAVLRDVQRASRATRKDCQRSERRSLPPA